MSSDKQKVIAEHRRPDQRMGQRRLKERGFSPAGRRRLKKRLKHYSNRLRRRNSREIINRQLDNQ
jgi:hypothetical protein